MGERENPQEIKTNSVEDWKRRIDDVYTNSLRLTQEASQAVWRDWDVQTCSEKLGQARKFFDIISHVPKDTYDKTEVKGFYMSRVHKLDESIDSVKSAMALINANIAAGMKKPEFPVEQKSDTEPEPKEVPIVVVPEQPVPPPAHTEHETTAAPTKETEEKPQQQQLEDFLMKAMEDNAGPIAQEVRKYRKGARNAAGVPKSVDKFRADFVAALPAEIKKDPKYRKLSRKITSVQYWEIAESLLRRHGATSKKRPEAASVSPDSELAVTNKKDAVPAAAPEIPAPEPVESGSTVEARAAAPSVSAVPTANPADIEKMAKIAARVNKEHAEKREAILATEVPEFEKNRIAYAFSDKIYEAATKHHVLVSQVVRALYDHYGLGEKFNELKKTEKARQRMSKEQVLVRELANLLEQERGQREEAWQNHHDREVEIAKKATPEKPYFITMPYKEEAGHRYLIADYHSKSRGVVRFKVVLPFGADIGEPEKLYKLAVDLMSGKPLRGYRRDEVMEISPQDFQRAWENSQNDAEKQRIENRLHFIAEAKPVFGENPVDFITQNKLPQYALGIPNEAAINYLADEFLVGEYRIVQYRQWQGLRHKPSSELAAFVGVPSEAISRMNREQWQLAVLQRLVENAKREEARKFYEKEKNWRGDYFESENKHIAEPDSELYGELGSGLSPAPDLRGPDIKPAGTAVKETPPMSEGESVGEQIRREEKIDIANLTREQLGQLERHPAIVAYKEGSYEDWCRQSLVPGKTYDPAETLEAFNKFYWNKNRKEEIAELLRDGEIPDLAEFLKNVKP